MNPVTPPNPMTGQQAAELEAMRRMLVAWRGTFSVSFATCNSPALRDHLIDRLREDWPGLAVVSMTKDAGDPYGFVVSALDSRRPEALCVIDMERVIPAQSQDQPALHSLNASRELWVRQFQCPVVFWLPDYAITLLSAHARDFYRSRSHRFEFGSEAATAASGIVDNQAGDVTAASNLSRDEKQFRIAELEQRLDDAGDPRDAELMPHVLNWLNELALLKYHLGQLDDAEQNWRRMAECAEQTASETGAAVAYGNLGPIMLTRGDLDGAEKMHRKALEIHEKLGRREGMAVAYGNLGNVMRIRGDLDGAEQMLRKALELNEKLGRREFMASNYGNFGLIMETRGDREGAEEMLRKALEIHEEIGDLEGRATGYKNLGNVMYLRGDLDGAERLYRQSLEIEEKLGRCEGMAIDCGNLGLVTCTRGDPERAQEMWTKARDLFEQVGAKDMVEKMQAWIDDLPL